MKILCVHAPLTFVLAAGTLNFGVEVGPSLRAYYCFFTDGQAAIGSARNRRVRLKEQQASARIGGYEFEQLKLPDGQAPREACSPNTRHFHWRRSEIDSGL